MWNGDVPWLPEPTGPEPHRPLARHRHRQRRRADSGGEMIDNLRGLWLDVMGTHPVRHEPSTGAYVCRCGLTATHCPAQRAAIRNHLQNPDEVPWQPLPEDLPPC